MVSPTNNLKGGFPCLVPGFLVRVVYNFRRREHCHPKWPNLSCVCVCVIFFSNILSVICRLLFPLHDNSVSLVLLTPPWPLFTDFHGFSRLYNLTSRCGIRIHKYERTYSSCLSGAGLLTQYNIFFSTIYLQISFHLSTIYYDHMSICQLGIWVVFIS